MYEQVIQQTEQTDCWTWEGTIQFCSMEREI